MRDAVSNAYWLEKADSACPRQNTPSVISSSLRYSTLQASSMRGSDKIVTAQE